MSKKDQKTQRHGASPNKPGRSYGQNPRVKTFIKGTNDQRPQKSEKYRSPLKAGSSQDLWLFGNHPVLSALKNPNRVIRRLLLTKKTADQFLAEKHRLIDQRSPLRPEIVPVDVLENLLPKDCVHQGIALHTNPLPDKDLRDCCRIESDKPNLVLILDQVTDPHNVGAIIRSAVAFGVRALITTDRHSPPESGTLAKSASGALDALPWVRVTNLSRALDDLADMGYWRLGLDGTAELSIKEADFGTSIALVLGAEGKGLRKGTQDHCDALIKLPIHRAVESLNVSNAAAIALYEFSGS